MARRTRPLRAALVLGLLVLPVARAGACPVCESETGKQVRAGIFNEDFGPNLLATVLPFPVVLGAAAALHFGLRPGRGARGAGPPDPSADAH